MFLFSLFWLESNFRIRFIFPKCVYITFSSPLSSPFNSKVCDWNLKLYLKYNKFCWKNPRQSEWTKHFLRGQVQVSSDAQDLYQLRMKCFLDRKQRGVKMHHGWSGGGLRFYWVRDSTYFSEFAKIFHIISPSGAEYCSQANYKGADPSCVQGWTSRFNFVVGIISPGF